MAKIAEDGAVPIERFVFDPASPAVQLDAARDETVAFQVILRGRSMRVPLVVSDLKGPTGARIAAREHVRRFLGVWVRVDPGGYRWGPPSRVLPWPASYPDALVPFEPECGLPGAEGDVPIRTIDVPPRRTVWVDVHVPGDAPAGRWAGQLSVASLRIPIALQVHEATLPARPTLQAVGEVYAAYAAEGAGRDLASPAWVRMAHCVQRLAHRHRAVFIERFDAPVTDWVAYDRAFGPALDGSLFDRENGWVGPGEGTPVAIWRTPWPQPYDGALSRPLDDEEVRRYEALARQWDEHATRRGWSRTRFFSYVFDEVDGPQDSVGGTGPPIEPTDGALAMAHHQMRRVQAALDAGARATPIDLLWTGHTDPSLWAGRPGIDLRGTIRLWAPSAQAAPPVFLAQRIRAAEHAWFYHAGHPSVGVHSINASGIELRTWGAIASRYGLGGHLVWAVNFSDPERPYAHPSYRPDDDRFGNGTLIYPGAKLPEVGLPARHEPVPSMRLKAWRAGLQDADLVALARAAGHGAEVDRLLAEMIPRALADGHGAPAWPDDSARWNRFHLRLLDLATR